MTVKNLSGLLEAKDEVTIKPIIERLSQLPFAELEFLFNVSEKQCEICLMPECIASEDTINESIARYMIVGAAISYRYFPECEFTGQVVPMINPKPSR